MQNRQIVDSSGEEVGYIHDVLLNLQDGRIEYICIALRDSAVSGRSEVVIPWSALRVRDDGQAHWQVAAGKSVLKRIAQPMARRS